MTQMLAISLTFVYIYFGLKIKNKMSKILQNITYTTGNVYFTRQINILW